MKIQIGQNIRALRHKRQVSQEDLAATMGVTVQAISKWETGKANPDLMLLPKLAEYFEVTIDNLFYINEAENMLTEDTARILEQNTNWWAGISESDLTTIALPNYGFFTPTEDTLCLLGDVRGKTVLEIACGSGDSLVWMGEKGAKELWGLDISAAQIKRTDLLLKKRVKTDVELRNRKHIKYIRADFFLVSSCVHWHTGNLQHAPSGTITTKIPKSTL